MPPLLARFWLLHALLPGIALAGILGGFHLGRPALAAAGVLVLGVRFLLAGGLALRERQIIVRNANYRRFGDAVRAYRGAAALPMGLAGLLVGSMLAMLALAHLAGMSLEAMRAMLMRQPAPGLVPAGLALCPYGLGFLLGFQDHGERIEGSRAWQFLLRLPERLGGIILVLLGAGLLVAAIWRG